MPDQPIAIRVAIQRPIYKLLDYACDPSLSPCAGCRVSVKLGNLSITGIVVEVDVKSEFSDLKPVLAVLDKSPLLDASLLNFLRWASAYYHYPIGEVLFHALPADLRKGKNLPQRTLWSVNQNEQNDAGKDDKRPPPTFCTILDSLQRAPKQQKLFEFLLEHREVNALQFRNKFGDSWRAPLNQLIKKRLVESWDVDADYFSPRSKLKTPKKTRLQLTHEQQQAVEKIEHAFSDKKSRPVLLHGITGSGKTEVYLRAIEKLLDRGKQILVLVPEIGLTPQLLLRFESHFPQTSMVLLHSGLSGGDRTRAWLGARSGAIQIVIGTRSAVFTPMVNLGAIVIDEEHDASFKQQQGFMYQGRDMAIKRAYDANIPVLLGSATPSLESLYNAQQNRYHYLRLKQRPGSSKPPEMVLQDIRTLPLEAGISNLLLTEIRQHIDAGNQVMLFLNRRGFSPVLMCPDCGWHAVCEQCDRSMTYHAMMSKVICHHCSLEVSISAHCLACQKKNLTTLGQGTERIEAVLKSYFPKIPIIRIDRDSTARKGALEHKLDEVNQGKPVILVGTQMLTKGHDFPKLTLVGILDVDQALFSADYRSQERLVQQVLQVAGRAGRGVDRGRVVLQTAQPQHPLLLQLLSQGYAETAKQILNERSLWNYPPLGSQALIRVNAESQLAARRFIDKVSHQFREQQNNNVDILGPVPSPLAKRANRYRFQMLLSAKKRGDLHCYLTTCLDILTGARKTAGVRWSLDIDPIDFV